MKVNLVKYIPNELEKDIIYLSLEYETAIHLCPCGCGEKVVTPLDVNYGWKYEYDEDSNLLTLSPSLLNKWCNTHYYIVNSEVNYC